MREALAPYYKALDTDEAEAQGRYVGHYAH